MTTQTSIPAPTAEIFHEPMPESLTSPPDVTENILAEAEVLPEPEPIILAFTGDINLGDNWITMQHLAKQANGLSDCISPVLLERMNNADVLLINHEFTLSDRGEPLNDKLYVFRGKTENVKYLVEMGADLACLANNHIYDYGKNAFFDTLDTLAGAGIATIGAGRNLEEAMEPWYFTKNDLTIAYVAATRAEKYILTPAATQDSPGVLRTYDSALFLEAVRNARINADVVIAVVHWGTEYSYDLEDAQTQLARELIEHGADLVVGSHPHCLQGIEFYQGKPIVYSLGNFWFNEKTLASALLEVSVSPEDELTLIVHPCLQENVRVDLLSEAAERRAVFDLLESISPEHGIVIDENGIVFPVIY